MAVTENVRREQIRKALEAHDPTKDASADEQWKGNERPFPIIRLGLEYVVLNPRSHRIQAQLESAENRDEIRADPWSDASQEALADLLRATEGFERLRVNLSEEPQRDYGIITAAGMLVNANTRAVALRDLGKAHIKVIVLPEDATTNEIDEIELRLQMQQPLRQEYTFTNELLFVDELIVRHHHSRESVARLLRWAGSSDPAELKKGSRLVDQATRMLSIIREIQELSGRTLPLTFFELDERYQDLKGKDAAKAAAVKDARILALLTDRLGYKKLRNIDEDFIVQYWVPAMEDDPLLKECVPAMVGGASGGKAEGPEGLDVLEGVEPATDGTVALGPLAEALAKASASDSVALPASDGEAVTATRDQVIDAVTDSLLSASEEKAIDAKKGSRLEQPAAILSDVDRKLKRVLDLLPDVRPDPEFDSAGFSDALATLERRVASIRKQVDSD